MSFGNTWRFLGATPAPSVTTAEPNAVFASRSFGTALATPPHIEAPARLHAVRLFETPRNFAEFFGPGAPA